MKIKNKTEIISIVLNLFVYFDNDSFVQELRLLVEIVLVLLIV